MNGICHASLVHSANRINLHSDLLHMVENLKIAYGTSWTSRRMSWKNNGLEIGLYMSNNS